MKKKVKTSKIPYFESSTVWVFFTGPGVLFSARQSEQWKADLGVAVPMQMRIFGPDYTFSVWLRIHSPML